MTPGGHCYYQLLLGITATGEPKPLPFCCLDSTWEEGTTGLLAEGVNAAAHRLPLSPAHNPLLLWVLRGLAGVRSPFHLSAPLRQSSLLNPPLLYRRPETPSSEALEGHYRKRRASFQNLLFAVCRVAILGALSGITRHTRRWELTQTRRHTAYCLLLASVCVSISSTTQKVTGGF